MRYPREVVDEVRLQNDIVEVISQYVPLKQKGSSYFGLCPFHNEKTASFPSTAKSSLLLLRLRRGRKCVFLFNGDGKLRFPRSHEASGGAGAYYPARTGKKRAGNRSGAAQETII